MIRKLIVPAALLALSACAGSPTEPAARTGALRANPAFGSGAGLLPPAEDNGGMAGSGAVYNTTLESGGYLGSGNLAEPPADATKDGSAIIGTGAKTEEAPQIGSGAQADGGFGMGSGN